MRILPPFPEVEDRHPRLGLCPDFLTIEQLALQSSEESFAQGVVVTVADQPHRGTNSGLLASIPEGDQGYYRVDESGATPKEDLIEFLRVFMEAWRGGR
jgi:hypothetical protein